MAALVPTARRVRTAAAAAVLGIGTLGLTANTAAFAQSDQFKGQTLTVQHNPISSNKAGFETYYKAIAAEFAKQTGATVKYVTSAQSINEQMPQIMATHAGPDVIGASSMEAAWQSDAFMKFTDADWKVLGGLDQFPPGQLGGSGPQGGPYVQVPGYNQPYAMIYNTKLFAKAGLTRPPTTWTEFIEYAQKINDPANGVYGTGFDPGDSRNQDSWKTPFYFLNGYGGGFYDKNAAPTLNSDASVKAYDFWFSWYTKFKIVDPNSLTWQNPQMQAAFAAGKIGLLPAVNGSIAALTQQGAVGNDFAFAALPVVPYGMTSLPPGGGPPSRLAQAGWYVGSYAKNKDLALQWIKVTLMPEFQLLQFEQTGQFPVTKKGVELSLASPAAKTLKPFLEVITQYQQPVPYKAWWNLAQTGLIAMGTQLASKVATNGTVTTAEIKAALSAVQKSVSQSQ